MIQLAATYLLVFGALALAGGVLGFVKARSRASLLAGGVSGLLLLVAGYLVQSGQTQAGLILGAVLSAALAARFVPAFLKSRKVMPAGLMALLGVGGVILTALALMGR